MQCVSTFHICCANRERKRITDFRSVTLVWIDGESKVRDYASTQEAFAALKATEQSGKKVRVVYVQDRSSGLKLFASQALPRLAARSGSMTGFSYLTGWQSGVENASASAAVSLKTRFTT